MYKKLSYIFLALFISFALILSGCSSNATPTPPSNNTATIQQSAAVHNLALQQPLQNTQKTQPAMGKLVVSYTDVGQGDCILVQAPSGKNMLIDAGTNDMGNTVVDYIKKPWYQ